MATRVIKLREAEEPAPDMVQEVLSQSKRPEVGRFLLQVDRQTKGSYATAEAAEKAGMLGFAKSRLSVITFTRWPALSWAFARL